MKPKICFIGAGNLATQLSVRLQAKGYDVIQVYSRTIESAEILAKSLDAQSTSAARDVTLDADLYIVAIKDSAVNKVLSQVDFKDKLLVHCSGSLPLSILKEHSQNSGILYPLQTLSKSRNVDFNRIPIFIEANSLHNEKILRMIGNEISDHVSVLNSEKRRSLHVAAVFACNFVNHMYTVAAEYLDSKDIAFDVLKPLILETANKVQEMKPRDAQTGPAVRFDENIINDHLTQLADFPEYQELYNSISKSIFDHHQEKNR